MSGAEAANLAAKSDPKSVQVNVTTGTGMEILWKDGHASSYSFSWLRDACPCAMCDEERAGSGRAIGARAKPAPGALPMYHPPVRPNDVTAVGKYAISFQWNDGHQHGIYSWEFLRNHCPCAECKAAREKETVG
jgi:DUF971 family protein